MPNCTTASLSMLKLISGVILFSHCHRLIPLLETQKPLN